MVSRLKTLTAEYRDLKARLEQGGGPDKVKRQHDQKKLTARVRGRPVVVVANDATVKAGSWWPETIKKILRAQEIAMRQRIPIVYLVDSAGVNLPYQGGVFPGQYGAARIVYYNSYMRRYLGVPQSSSVMGPCI